MTNLASKLGWWWLAIGIAVGFAIFATYLKTGYRDPELVRLAQKNGYDVDDYIRAVEIAKQCDEKVDLRPDQIQDLVRFVADDDPDFRARNCGLLARVPNPEFRPKAIELSCILLDDPEDPFIQASALLNLKRLDAPEWRQAAQEKLNHPNEHVRSLAQRLLNESPG